MMQIQKTDVSGSRCDGKVKLKRKIALESNTFKCDASKKKKKSVVLKRDHTPSQIRSGKRVGEVSEGSLWKLTQSWGKTPLLVIFAATQH